ncbi:probable S-adenosylmethionine-dependent methyltransferase At5g38780 [Neltuma alba]|uniref:probable S-adenosylmethionine-dependent methyltransferase At5g38780 n=1 Tax=Neltuma alba TaxID=207710 RepID=UPI0010A31D23|nr:probable S-adenosylmethionine-dependent methyltransferase At5g38780 [Prosopis alba]
MGSQKGSESYQAFPMNGGDGQHSYAQNSTNQRRGTDSAKNIINETILEKLNLETHLQNSSHTFRIADLGCSVGPNTFFTVQNIIEPVNLKYQSQEEYTTDSVEFQVFFNDHVGNDFNTLFKSLPEDKQYFAAAMPGSFHGRLFPESSIHVFNSSYTLHWLSKVPKEIVDKNSRMYNKGKIYFTSEDKEVAEAYSAQFERDLESFLNSRVLELVPGGIMILIICCVPPNALNSFQTSINIMGNVLAEMANKGLLSEELVDSFNIPIYVPTSEEARESIKKNGNFKIVKSEFLFRLMNSEYQRDAHSSSMHFRAALEGVFKEHFEHEIVDDMFVQLEKRLASEASILTDPRYKELGELLILKRN